jgi:hypothetical protein
VLDGLDGKTLPPLVLTLLLLVLLQEFPASFISHTARFDIGSDVLSNTCDYKKKNTLLRDLSSAYSLLKYDDRFRRECSCHVYVTGL